MLLNKHIHKFNWKKPKIPDRNLSNDDNKHVFIAAHRLPCTW